MTLRLRFFLGSIVAGVLLCANFNASAANEGHALSEKIAKARLSGQDFREVALFAPTSAEKHPLMLEKETTLKALTGPVSELYESHPEAISLTMRSDDGREYKLDLLRSHPTAEDANMGYIDATGRHRVAYTEGLHYQGAVTGSEKSLAALSVFANGDIMLLFANEEGNFVVGKLEDGSGNYIFYNDQSMRVRPENPCGVSDDYDGEVEPGTQEKTTQPFLCNKVQLYWEATYNLYVSKASSLPGTQTYLTGLFNQYKAMYANEKIDVELKSLYIWVVQDDFSTASSSAALDRFRGYWNALSNGFDGDIAQIIARTGQGRGGLAYVDVLCNRSSAYAYNDIQGTYQTVPTYSWDVEVTTHETGHNLGSKHTHWCGWMTGAGGTCGSIDNCTTQEASTGCTTCGSTFLNSAPTTAWQGTVMSYCHLVARKTNLANGFGPLPGNKIRTEVSSAGCLGSLISARLTATPICANNGAVTLTFASNNSGTTPYVYNWSNNAHTQSLISLNTPGVYSVQIIDSNGCIAGYNTEVIRRPAPGNGIVPPQKMPICCSSGNLPLTLSSAAPKDLTSCQSVYWLRSAISPGTYAVAKSIFDTTQSANAIASTNSSTISSTEGAILNVLPPVSCSSKLTYYYTPVVVQLPHAANSITASGTGSTAFTRFGTTIGRYVSLPDQSSVPTTCDVLDTPSARSISVTVSSYTGRANNMRLVVQDAANLVVYERFGLLGNGTYVIPGSAISGEILQSLKVSVFDYNCTNTACTASAATLGATRTVTYAARPASIDPSCAIGTSIKVEFAPTACTKLDVETAAQASAPRAELFPNPASGFATLAFTTTSTGKARLKVTDMLGKIILTEESSYAPGRHQQMIDVRTWARGVYFVNIGNLQGSAERLKLVVE